MRPRGRPGARRCLVPLLALLALLGAGCTAEREEGEPPSAPAGGSAPLEGPPSILLISLDTTRADRLGCYGHERAFTPWIDRWAEEGVLFEQALTPVPVTLPAHASLLSGLVPARHGLRDNGLHRLPGGIPTLATLLGAEGYDTAAVVGAAVLDRQYGLARGFTRYDDRVSGGGLAIAERRASEVTDAALSLAEGLGHPYLLLVHFFDPHADYDPPPPFDERFRGRLYDGEIAYMDREIGRLRRGLEERGLLRGAVTVIVGDHGEGLGDHGEATHGVFLYQSTLRVPLILAAPGRLPAGRRIPGAAGLVDLLPTLLELAGVAVPEGLDGRSLLPAIEGEAGRTRDRLYRLETDFPFNSYGWSPLRGLTDGKLKWIGAPEAELYDLEADPGESHNLAGERPEEVRDMSRLWRAGLTEDLRAPPPGGETVAEESERLERLRALGYVSAAGRPPPVGESLPDPKTVIGSLGLVNRARELLAAGRAAEAERLLEGVVAESPGNLSALILLGSARIQSGDFAEALSPLERAVELSPTHADARYNLGLARMGAGDPAGAEREWHGTLALSPRYHDAAANLIDLLQRSGRSPEAEQVLRRARSEGLDSPVLDYLEARLAYERGDRQTARRAVTRALAGPLPPALESEARALAAALGGP